MKSIIDYINENINITEANITEANITEANITECNITEGSHDAENAADKTLKGIVNKKMSLDELSDILGEEGWEFCEEVPGKNGDNDMLVYACNFTNNAEGDDDFLDIEVEKQGNSYKILSYTLE